MPNAHNAFINQVGKPITALIEQTELIARNFERVMMMYMWKSCHCLKVQVEKLKDVGLTDDCVHNYWSSIPCSQSYWPKRWPHVNLLQSNSRPLGPHGRGFITTSAIVWLVIYSRVCMFSTRVGGVCSNCTSEYIITARRTSESLHWKVWSNKEKSKHFPHITTGK